MFLKPLTIIAAVIAAISGHVATAVGQPGQHTARAHVTPRAADTQSVQRLASGLHVVTAFAFGDGQTFAGSGGSPNGRIGGGVYVIRGGRARALEGMPRSVFGLAWRDGTLYVSTWRALQAYSNWNGSQFLTRRRVYSTPKHFTGFNGLAFAPDGRLWAGVMTGNDHRASRTPYARDIISMNPDGSDVQIVARGIRQPWQMVFPQGSSAPFVTDLGQDSGARNPQDFLLRVSAGQNYGFPACNWTSARACRGYARPFHFFVPHTTPMGVTMIGSQVYVAAFNGRIMSIPMRGGRARTVASGFGGNIVGLATDAGWLYVGGYEGGVYRVRP